ncbi:hypothetical protein D3C80_1284000 [compost metagenome]
MLALDFLEVVDGVHPALGLQALIAGVVERLDRAFFIGQARAGLVARAGGHGQGRDDGAQHDQAGTRLRSGPSFRNWQGRPHQDAFGTRTHAAPSVAGCVLYNSARVQANPPKSMIGPEHGWTPSRSPPRERVQKRIRNYWRSDDGERMTGQ